MQTLRARYIQSADSRIACRLLSTVYVVWFIGGYSGYELNHHYSEYFRQRQNKCNVM